MRHTPPADAPAPRPSTERVPSPAEPPKPDARSAADAKPAQEARQQASGSQKAQAPTTAQSAGQKAQAPAQGASPRVRHATGAEAARTTGHGEGADTPQVDPPDLEERPNTVLARDEVAAVSYDRAFYVSDVATPYLTEHQAQEDFRKTRRRHSAIVTVIVVLVVLAVVGGVSGYLWQTMHHTEEKVDVYQYQTAVIERGEFLANIDTTSLVRPIDEVTVLPTVSGNVVEIVARDGAHVEIGDVLYRLENPTITEAYAKAQTSLDEARSVADAKNLALEEANATVSALETAAAAAPDDRATAAALQTAINNLEPARVEAEAASATLKTYEDTFERAKEQQDALTVTAPIAGTVGQINPEVTVGTPVTNSVRLCIVSDLSRKCVDMQVPPSEISRITVGMEVRVNFPTIPGLAVVTTVDSLRDEGSIHLARIGINDPDPRITVGTLASCTIVIQSIPDCLIVPLDAIQIGDDGLARLHVLLDPSRGIKTEVMVSIIATNGSQAAITADNIQEGNSVILNSSLAEQQQAQARAEAEAAVAAAEAAGQQLVPDAISAEEAAAAQTTGAAPQV